MQKILIIHDRFQFRGGAERLVLDLAKILHADIVTEFWTETTYPKSDVPHDLTILDDGEPRMMVLRYFRAQWNFWWKTRNLIKKYDTIIFSGNNCLAAALRPMLGKKTIYYCHAPVRFVYDLLERRRAEEPLRLKRIVYYDIGKFFIRACYRAGLARMQTVVTNSQNVHDRLVRFCDQESQIIYPPIHTKKFSWQGQGDYYLSFARLDKLKRVDEIVRAFQQMPDKKLVIASGGEDAERITELSKGYANIRLAGWIDDEKLKELVGNCIATIYIPVDEDFGMSAVEGMSAGKPCIGVDEGGLREIIIENKNGTRIPAQFTTNDIVHAVNEMTPERALAMRNDCEASAQRFSVERFAQEMRALVETPRRDVSTTRIAIDASRSIDSVQKTGVEVVSDELLKQRVRHCGLPACRQGRDPQSIVFYTPQSISWIPQEQQTIITRHKLWTIVGLSLAMLRDKPDALFVPVHTLPFFCPKKTVRIIHDVSFLRHKEAYSLRERTYMKFDLWRAKRICSHVVVPTQAVKDDLVNLLHWSAEKIVVTGWGVPSSTASHQPSTKNHQPKTILFIGRIEEKKNVANLIRAFALFRETHPDSELVLAGKPGFGFETIEPLLATPGVKYLGYISDEQKADLLAHAEMLALLSYEEGFAFPMLEAFQANVPVIASSIPTLTEIAEDAALFASPDDIQKHAENMSLIADSQELAHDLIAKGKEKLKKYSWEEVSAKVFSLLE